MIELHKAGIIPHLQVHDELDISVKDDKEAKQVIEIIMKGAGKASSDSKKIQKSCRI